MTPQKLQPFFTLYGAKWRLAPRYPAPTTDRLVESFAGSAGYSLRHPEREVILVERDPVIAATWRYLLAVSPAEILSLPDVQPGQRVADVTSDPDARRLIGWWCGKGCVSPRHTAGRWFARKAAEGWSSGRGGFLWGPEARARIARQLPAIRHWRVIEGDYTAAPEGRATWFVDPPYQRAGTHYRHGSKGLDYAALGAWCAARTGRVIVCENVGAAWGPFEPFRDAKGMEGPRGGKVSREALWTFDTP